MNFNVFLFKVFFWFLSYFDLIIVTNVLQSMRDLKEILKEERIGYIKESHKDLVKIDCETYFNLFSLGYFWPL